MTKYDKILGGLLAAAIGDAMGGPTETRPTELIIERFGGLVRDFVTPPDDVFVRNKPAGYVTDDFSLAYYTALSIVDGKGVVTDEVAKKALIDWYNSEYSFMAGPTTRARIMTLLGEPQENKLDFLACDNSKASNGLAMKIGPVGYISGGDIDKAIADTVTIARPTHFNNLALSGGCAVAAAAAKAMGDNVTVEDLVEAGIYGAKKGYEIGCKDGKFLAGAKVDRRIEMAVEIALKIGDPEKVMYELEDIIGGGLPANEAVPTAFGLIMANKDDAFEAIVGGVNVGNDTDTVATIVGSIVGPFKGWKVYDPKFLKTLNEVNNFDLEKLAKDLEAVC